MALQVCFVEKKKIRKKKCPFIKPLYFPVLTVKPAVEHSSKGIHKYQNKQNMHRLQTYTEQQTNQQTRTWLIYRINISIQFIRTKLY